MLFMPLRDSKKGRLKIFIRRRIHYRSSTCLDKSLNLLIFLLSSKNLSTMTFTDSNNGNSAKLDMIQNLELLLLGLKKILILTTYK